MQDRQIASSDTVVAAANTRMYWAEIIGENPDVWVKGLSGEPLTANEAAHFEALAVAWDLTYYASFNTSQQIGGEVANLLAGISAIQPAWAQ